MCARLCNNTMRRKLSIPGLEQYPDLQKKFEYEIVRSGGCRSGCQSNPVIRTYARLLRERQAQEAQSRLVKRR